VEEVFGEGQGSCRVVEPVMIMMMIMMMMTTMYTTVIATGQKNPVII
jgi:hypothetical protein